MILLALIGIAILLYLKFNVIITAKPRKFGEGAISRPSWGYTDGE